MADRNLTGYMTAEAAEALSIYRLVRINSSGKIALNGAGERPDGSAENNFASGAANAVMLDVRVPGTRTLIASGAVTAGVLVYADASGKVSATAVGEPVGRALTATSNDGERLEVFIFSGAGNAGIVETKTADFSIAASDSGKTYSSAGASGTITGSLPAATVGLRYSFRVGAAQQLRIDPNGTETISLPSTGVPGAAGKYLVADAAGETVELRCVVAGTWSVFGYTGTWTAEP